MNIAQCRRSRDSFPDPRVRVLLVDDSDIIRQTICRVLGNCGRLDVIGTAADGLQALEAVRVHCPDLVLIDGQMPHMNGLEAAARIRQEFPATQVILLSCQDQSEYGRVAEQVGAIFVPKAQLVQRFCELFTALFGVCPPHVEFGAPDPRGTGASPLNLP